MVNKINYNNGNLIKCFLFGLLIAVICLTFSLKSIETFASGNEQIPNRSDTTIYTAVEQMPEFEGGMEGLMRFLTKNLKYPYNTLNEQFNGSTYVSFIIMEDGSVSNVKIIKSLSPICDPETIRVIKSTSGKWKPGKQKGKAVKVRFALPIHF